MPDRASSDAKRVTLVLRKPFGWFPKPTVVIGGRGQPAQWGEGTWRVPAESSVELSVFLFNRVWRYGHASIRIRAGESATLEYRPPLLPFFRGALTARARRD